MAGGGREELEPRERVAGEKETLFRFRSHGGPAGRA